MQLANIRILASYFGGGLHVLVVRSFHTYGCVRQFARRWIAQPWPYCFIIIIDNRGLNARWCLTPLLLSLPTAAYLGQRGLIPAGLPHTTAQCRLTVLGEAVLFCLNHPSFRTPYCLPVTCFSVRVNFLYSSLFSA